MTLLETIRNSVAANSGGGDPKPPLKFPVLLHPDDAFLKLTPEDEGSVDSSSIVCRVSGWQISNHDSESMKFIERFIKKLSKLVKNPKPSSKGEVSNLLKSLPMETFDSLVGGEVVGLVVDACVAFQLWEMLETLIVRGIVKKCTGSGLLEKLVVMKRTDLVCVYAKHVSELRSSEISAIIEYFLFPTKDSYGGMVEVRKEWERQCLFAIEKATQKGALPKVLTLAKDASILLMMAYDGFSTSELCLHYVFSSPSLEGLVLSTAISRLDNATVLGLVKYFRKWLEKYKRFPEAVSCLAAAELLALRMCECVPSLESVVMGFGLVLDEHLSYLVLNPVFHEEMKATEEVVKALAAEANACCYLANVIENMPSDLKRH